MKSDVIGKMQIGEYYITVKDHNEDFPHKISCRLINPSKSDIEKVSKIMLDKINSDILSSVQANQWKNLYGLGILQNSSCPEIEQKRKQIIQILKRCGLNITVKINLMTVDFLDLRFELINNT